MANFFNDLKTATANSMIKVFGFDSLRLDNKQVTTPEQAQKFLDKALNDLQYTNSAFVGLNGYGRVEAERIHRYREYDIMDNESDVISTSLDIYTEDATDFDTFVGARMWVTSPDEKLAKSMTETLHRLKLEQRVPRIARNLAKHGDFFLGITPNKNAKVRENQGIERVDTSYYPRDVKPIVKDYKLLGYWLQDTESSATTISTANLKAPWNFVHFALPGDANFVTHDAVDNNIARGSNVEYGQSLLKSARRPYKRSKLMHDILAYSRMSRSALKRVFKFQTDSNNPIQQITALATFKKVMEKIGGIDTINENMDYDQLVSVMSQDIYIPIGKDGKGDYAFDTIGGEVDVSNIVDIEMWDNRLYMSLRIPKEFLNFSEATGDRSTLLLKDIRYAKRIKRLQRAIIHGIKEVLIIEEALKGNTVSDTDFELNMASTSISEDLERLDYYGNAVGTADSLTRMLESFEPDDSFDSEGEEGTSPDKVDKSYLVYYILKYVVKLPNFDLKTYYPVAAEHGEQANKKESVMAKKASQIVEKYKPLIDKKFNEAFGKKDLDTVVEHLNIDTIKEFTTTGVPEDFSYDTESMKKLCENMIAEQHNKKETIKE